MNIGDRSTVVVDGKEMVVEVMEILGKYKREAKTKTVDEQILEEIESAEKSEGGLSDDMITDLDEYSTEKVKEDHRTKLDGYLVKIITCDSARDSIGDTFKYWVS